MKKSSLYLFMLFYAIMIAGCFIGGFYFLWKGSYVAALFGVAIGIWMLKPNKDS